MIDLRLPDELYQTILTRSEALNLDATDFLQLLLNSYPIWTQALEASPEFQTALQASLIAHSELLASEELWA